MADDGQALEAALKFSERIAENAALAIRATKRVIGKFRRSLATGSVRCECRISLSFSAGLRNPWMFAGPVVEFGGNVVEDARPAERQVGVLREVLV
ncbi:hypothetical protein CBI38_33040 (plasmid) [Rhodococcus oxybenzonivorans]|uniref:Uncharacterized protein n=1 Tax=Rhodococcus oxybenzonivorans TaxID=1990687 RepID=A0A2S2C680_9NOCA|nr:hypothetical protein CBI38_33040 [Rhodococcus oxybenzonivorans]